MHKDFSFEDLNFKQETTEHLLYSMIEVLHDVRRNTIKVRTVRSVAARMEQGGSHVEHDKTCTGGIT